MCGKPLTFWYLISPDLLVKPTELYGMPQTRNEYYWIGEAVLAHMRRSNHIEVTTEAGKATLDLMKTALRGDKSCTLSPEDGAPWGFPRGIVVNGSIDDNFGYEGLENNYAGLLPAHHGLHGRDHYHHEPPQRAR